MIGAGNSVTRYFSKVVYRTSKITRGAPFGLRSVGHARFRPGYGTPRRIVDFVHLIWTVAGTGYMEKFRREQAIPPGYVGLFLPGAEHRLYAQADIWEYRWVTIDGLYARELVSGFPFSGEPFPVGKCPKSFFLRLEREAQRIGLAEQFQATVSLYALLVYIAQKKSGSCKSTEDTSLASRAIRIMEQMTTDSAIGIRQIADQMAVHRSVFSRIFRTEIGIAPKEYLDSLRLRTVLTLLKETTLPIGQVALQAGFASSNYMAKYFRKKMAISPTGFRSRPF